MTIKQKTFIFLINSAWFLLCSSQPVTAVTPMWGYMSLVAGEGDAGFRDGEFYSSLFNHPVAVALNPQGTLLYVADRENHRIRVIGLEDSNKVSTLAGTGKRGRADGDLTNATFDRPSLLAFVPANRLAVYDAGTNRLRLIDLEKKKVTTLLSLSPKNPPNFPDLVYGLAYLPGDQSLYFSQPGVQKLTRFDLQTGKTKTIHPDARLPKPGALTVEGDKLCAADLRLPTVYRFDAITDNPDGGLTASLTELGKGQTIISLAA